MAKRWVQAAVLSTTLVGVSGIHPLGDTQDQLPPVTTEGVSAEELEMLHAALYEPTGDRGFGSPPEPTEGLTEQVSDTTLDDSAENPGTAPESAQEDAGTAPETPDESGQGDSPETHNSVTIGSYVNCDGNPQPCIDAGNLTYYSGTGGGKWSQFLGGHDYDGWDWLHSVPVGTTVHIEGGVAAGTYEVFDHVYINRQGGSIPYLAGDLALQSCKGDGTGFSLLRKV